nr:MAG TPA: hypothetical protein [Caudoviricetes sp.]
MSTNNTYYIYLTSKSQVFFTTAQQSNNFVNYFQKGNS